jgi:catechol 2,3-dioxygenase-like lactoylglutathione lyase family enzyme
MAATIGPIVGVTIATPDLRASEAAYVEHLGYRPGSRGRVSREQAALWGRPAAAGSPCLSVHPPAGADFAFRFVETAPVSGYRAFACHGWNAAELIVADVDALAVSLRGSPFEMLGPPQDLSFTDAIRAMQVRGPAGEILYLTQFKRPLESLPSPVARCPVDRVFIVIVGGASLDELLDFYARRFGVALPQRMESRVKAMSEAFGLSPEHRYQIAALPLQGSCYIEADQMPATARPPDTAADRLPPGIAIVSFQGHGPACQIGAAGELIETLPG